MIEIGSKNIFLNACASCSRSNIRFISSCIIIFQFFFSSFHIFYLDPFFSIFFNNTDIVVFSFFVHKWTKYCCWILYLREIPIFYFALSAVLFRFILHTLLVLTNEWRKNTNALECLSMANKMKWNENRFIKGYFHAGKAIKIYIYKKERCDTIWKPNKYFHSK